MNPRIPMLPHQQQSQPSQLQQSSPQHQQHQAMPSPMSHHHNSPMNVNHHSPMNPQMMGGQNAFVQSPMNSNSGMPPQQARSGTPGGNGPKRTSTPSASNAEFDLDFLDNISPQSNNGSANGMSVGNNGGQKRIQQQQQQQQQQQHQQQQQQDILNYLQ
jgi:hypothetical protein